ARWNTDIFFAGGLCATFTVAIVARVFNFLAAAMTGGTGLLNTKETLLHTHLSHAAAGGTGYRLRTVPRARALACIAIVPTWHANGFCGAAHGLLKGNFHGITQISAARRAAT